jgi:translation initiation factor 2B subunit (eIF-2B alpha/beta/delta family)
MEWDEFEEAAAALSGSDEKSASRLAQQGATLLHRALSEMFLGEPENLRRVAWRIAEARPRVVAIRNVGVAAFTTAKEARVGDRMAASARSAARLARLLEATPKSLGRRIQPLMKDHIVTSGYSLGVHEALVGARDRLKSVIVLEGMDGGPELVERLLAANISAEFVPQAESVAAMRSAEVTLIGCSALVADGSAIADHGANQLARVAMSRGVPVYALADTLKLAPWLPRGASGDGSWEVVPPTMIEHVVTEDGIRRPHQLLSAARDLSTRWKSFEPRPNS